MTLRERILAANQATFDAWNAHDADAVAAIFAPDAEVIDVAAGSVLTTAILVQELITGGGDPWFTGQLAGWLWFTVLFANLAEAMAEGRGKAQAATLRRARAETMARRLDGGGEALVPASSLRAGDTVRVDAGELIPGDGEIVGSGLESTADVTFQLDLIKGKRIRWPRIENDEFIMVAGSVRPLVDAMRIAYVELIEWLVAEYGFEKIEAYQLTSQVGVVRVANIVDPNYTIVAKFPKRLLPPRQP